MEEHSELIGRIVIDSFIDYGDFIGKIIDKTNGKYRVLFTDGDIISYSLKYIKHILIDINNANIVKRGKYYYKIINNKYHRISELEYNEYNDIAFILCSLKY